VEAHQDGERQAYENRSQRKEEVLNADDLVVDAEDIFANKPRRRMTDVYRLALS
jgi:hypothetical protein